MKPFGFRLPYGYSDDGGTIHREGQLRSLSGHEEEWLIQKYSEESSIKMDSLLNYLLGRCVQWSGSNDAISGSFANRLLPADRQYLLVKLWEVTFGSRVQGTVLCPGPGCGQKVDIDFSVLDIPCREEEESDPLSTDPSSIDLEMEVECVGCGEVFTMPFDVHNGFFKKLRTGLDMLYREVHSLAYHYHWSEGEIMEMPRPKRYKYISILADELERMNNGGDTQPVPSFFASMVQDQLFSNDSPAVTAKTTVKSAIKENPHEETKDDTIAGIDSISEPASDGVFNGKVMVNHAITKIQLPGETKKKMLENQDTLTSSLITNSQDDDKVIQLKDPGSIREKALDRGVPGVVKAKDSYNIAFDIRQSVETEPVQIQLPDQLKPKTSQSHQSSTTPGQQSQSTGEPDTLSDNGDQVNQLKDPALIGKTALDGSVLAAVVDVVETIDKTIVRKSDGNETPHNGVHDIVQSVDTEPVQIQFQDKIKPKTSQSHLSSTTPGQQSQSTGEPETFSDNGDQVAQLKDSMLIGKTALDGSVPAAVVGAVEAIDKTIIKKSDGNEMPHNGVHDIVQNVDTESIQIQFQDKIKPKTSQSHLSSQTPGQQSQSTGEPDTLSDNGDQVTQLKDSTLIGKTALDGSVPAAVVGAVEAIDKTIIKKSDGNEMPHDIEHDIVQSVDTEPVQIQFQDKIKPKTSQSHQSSTTPGQQLQSTGKPETYSDNGDQVTQLKDLASIREKSFDGSVPAAVIGVGKAIDKTIVKKSDGKDSPHDIMHDIVNIVDPEPVNIQFQGKSKPRISQLPTISKKPHKQSQSSDEPETFTFTAKDNAYKSYESGKIPVAVSSQEHLKTDSIKENEIPVISKLQRIRSEASSLIKINQAQNVRDSSHSQAGRGARVSELQQETQPSFMVPVIAKLVRVRKQTNALPLAFWERRCLGRFRLNILR
jgi:hypothetical protein